MLWCVGTHSYQMCVCMSAAINHDMSVIGELSAVTELALTSVVSTTPVSTNQVRCVSVMFDLISVVARGGQ